MDRKQTDTGHDPERQAAAAGATDSAADSMADSGADSAAALETAVRRFRKGDLRGAEAMCRNILAARPRDVQALHLLGVVTARSDSKEIAVEFISKAVALDPGLAEAHVNLGVVLRNLGRLAEAVASCRRAIALQPDYAEAHGNLGVALRDQRKLDEAVAALRRAVALKPDFAEAHRNLGVALYDRGQLDEALDACRQAIALAPDDAGAHSNLGNVLRDVGRPDEAVAAYRRALALTPDYANAHTNLGNAFRALSRLDEAVACHRRAIALEPTFAVAHLNLGVALSEQGGLEEARAAIRRSLALKPDFPEAYFALSSLEPYPADDADLLAMQGLLEVPAASDQDTTLLSFALARAYEGRDDYDRAFEHFSRGNRVRRRAIEFDIDAEQDSHQRLAEVFSEALLSRLAGAGASSELPVFIVGMPRSGTTLVEQILASQGDVLGAGELGDMGRLVSGLRDGLGLSRPYPEGVAEIDFGQWRQMGEAFARALERRAPSKSRIVDKMPSNYSAIGLIHLMLPNARIIHCQRDPLDTCLSIFRLSISRIHFSSAHGPRYAYDLTELGQYYRIYDQLMEHWRVVLPGKVLDVRYEDVVADLEGSARRIVAHCGLEWSDACLDFHKLDRPVRTASAAQVRRPIYSTSIGRWRRYQRHLEPLVRVLGPCAARSAASG